MVKVCDAVMGSGKTSAAITYINEHPDNRFIFITPYLAEAARVRDSCPDARFVEPNAHLTKYAYSKVRHTEALIRDGRNIATTHQAFRNYNAVMLDDIQEKGYTLILDENMDILESIEVGIGDLDSFVKSGKVNEKDGVYSLGDQEYEGGFYEGMFQALETRKMIRLSDDEGGVLFFWMLPPGLIRAFKEVIVLTYMFEGQSLHHMMELNNIRYEHIGVKHTPDGSYRFTDGEGTIPEYVGRLKDVIHVLDDSKLNEIGRSNWSLSMNWYRQGGDRIQELKSCLYSYFRYMHGAVPAQQKLCASFSGYAHRIKGKGYTKSIVPFNLRATNDYRDRTCLAYPVNVFMNAGEKLYYYEHDVNVDEDAYALSTMVQWIWRSAIREGGEIDIYIPSRRMRELLLYWIDNVSKGVRASAV